MAVRGIAVMASFEVVHRRCAVVYVFKHFDCMIGFFFFVSRLHNFLICTSAVSPGDKQ